MDLVIPLPLSALIALKLLSDKIKPVLRIRLGWAALNLLSVTSLMVLSFHYETLAVKWGAEMLVTLWVTSAFAMLVSALFLWVGYSFYFRSEDSWVILPCMGLALSSITAQAAFSAIWNTLGPLLGGLACGYGELLYGSQIQCEFQNTSRLFIAHPHYGISIAQGCSGIDGITVFFYSLSIYALQRGKEISVLNWVLCLFVGCLGMITLKAVRILALFSLGVTLEELSPGSSRGMIPFLFHANLGWALYLAGILLLFSIMDRFFRRNIIEQKFDAEPSLTAQRPC